MAIDPRISLAVQVPRASQSISIFENALMNAQTRDLRANQEARAVEQAPVRAQILQQQATTGGIGVDKAREEARFSSLTQASQELKPILERSIASGDTSEAISFLQKRSANLNQRRAAGENVDTDDTDEALQMIQQGGVQPLLNTVNDTIGIARQRGLIKDPSSFLTAGQRDRASLLEDLNSTEPDVKRSAQNALGLKARAVGSAATTIAETGKTGIVAESQAKIEGAVAKAKETGKLASQLAFKPQITRAVKLAEKAAIERGDTLTDLARSKAALPGLNKAVDQLRELALVATSTLGGKIFDSAVKQTGFGATKGSTAKAKFIAIINNQVLPLLKPTFGGSFSIQEGESLKATMGDPEASPSEKLVQLDAFIAQKVRDIETKQSQLGGAEAQDPTSFSSEALGREVSEQDIQDTLSANPNVTREQLLQQLGIK